jgi:hypothetical protein
MSREEFGDAIAERATRTTSPPTTPTSQFDRATAGQHPGQGRRLAVTSLVLLIALSGVAGWMGGRMWDDNLEPAPADAPVAWATTVDARPRGESARRVLADVTIRITNLSRTPVTLTGAAATFDAGSIEAVTPDSVVIPVGASAETVAHASIACRAPQPLRLYPLQIRRDDHSLVTVRIIGDAAALTRICDAQAPDTRILAIVRTDEDGDRLELVLRSPTGRNTRVTALRAGGVTLTDHPPDDPVDGREHVFWLERPRSCPIEWLSTGLPRTVELDVDTGGPATVTLDTGYVLARWLRAGPCSGSQQ